MLVTRVEAGFCRKWISGMPAVRQVVEPCSWHIYDQSASNVLPYSETSDRIDRANVCYCKECGLPIHGFGRARPNGHPDRKENLLSG